VVRALVPSQVLPVPPSVHVTRDERPSLSVIAASCAGSTSTPSTNFAVPRAATEKLPFSTSVWSPSSVARVCS